ncbi:MAG: hypothetical protein DRR08_21985 [Candidatus Parabeggiatoa sp. nov. 2]|nr:MAG: hypothetical protein DRR08_21985 [Gammaproteobacteria bacterium]
MPAPYYVGWQRVLPTKNTQNTKTSNISGIHGGQTKRRLPTLPGYLNAIKLRALHVGLPLQTVMSRRGNPLWLPSPKSGTIWH